MKIGRLIALVAIFVSLCTPARLLAQSPFQYKGYVKELGAFSLSNDLATVRFDNIVHHRLETSWNIGDGFSLRADVRNRWISGYTARNIPEYGSLISTDPGAVDLSHNWVDRKGHVVNSSIDRLHGSWEGDAWEVHVGRQRLNWGKSMVWNPNDLFNTYAWLDFDYEERPGTDAVRIQHNWGFASSAELGYKITRDFDESVIAGMWRGNVGTYDLQGIAGYYAGDWILGGGWSGYIESSGFRGEASLFLPDGTLTASAGGDHMLASGVYVSGELLYNGGYSDEPGSEAGLFQPPRADNLFIAKTGYFVNVSASPHPLVSAGVGLMGSLTRSVHILIPQVSYSVAENLDFLVLAQLLRGNALRELTNTPNGVYLRLKWSY
jgi:hypothetical protein